MRCVLVDDHEPFLASARQVLSIDEVEIVALARTGDEAVDIANEVRPDLALVDVDLGRESGFDVARALSKLEDAPRVILISTHAEEDLAVLVAQSAAIGFIPKSRLSTEAVLGLLS